MNRALESGKVFVHGPVEGFERFFGQAFLVLVADVNASFLKGVDEGGISSDIGHGMNKNILDLGIAEIGFLFTASVPLHRE